MISPDDIPCPRCNAPPEEHCHTTTGKRTGYHERRWKNASKLDVLDQIEPYRQDARLGVELADLADSICPTVDEGWLWICGVHESHGESENESETRIMAGVHYTFHSAFLENCEMLVWQRTAHERSSSTIDLSGGNDGRE